jgi:hypothetical protein
MEKKYKKMNQKKKAIYILTTLTLFVLLFGCVFLDSVSVKQTYGGQDVAWARAGDVATFKINGHIEAVEDHLNVQFVAGFLAPRSWNVAQNAKVTYISSRDNPIEEWSMSVIPATSLPKNANGRTWPEALTQEYGVGPNVLNDMEWVVFWTDRIHEIRNHDQPTYTIFIRCNVGTQNLKAHLGFFINHTDDGVSTSADHKKVSFSNECFEVVEGSGGVIDYCNEHYNKVQPLSALQDDFITLSFVGGVAANSLTGASNVYVQATAYGLSGATYTVNEKSNKTLMKRENAFSDTYNLTIWPGGYFNIPASEEILRIEYVFTNADGSVTITQSDDDFAQEGTPIGAIKDPFVFLFTCD